MAAKVITPAMGRLLTVGQAAVLLGIGADRARRLIARGELTAVRNINGRLSGVYEADARAWQDRARAQVPNGSAAHDVDRQVRALVSPAERVF